MLCRINPKPIFVYNEPKELDETKSYKFQSKKDNNFDPESFVSGSSELIVHGFVTTNTNVNRNLPVRLPNSRKIAGDSLFKSRDQIRDRIPSISSQASKMFIHDPFQQAKAQSLLLIQMNDPNHSQNDNSPSESHHSAARWAQKTRSIMPEPRKVIKAPSTCTMVLKKRASFTRGLIRESIDS